MLGFRFIKADPTTYLMQMRRGKVVREGAGLSFVYYAPTSSIVAVPVGSEIVPFIFEHVTADYQPVTVQGHFSYRIAQPGKAANMLNFVLNPGGQGYATEDPRHLRPRVEGIAEVLLQQAISGHTLRFALQAVERIARQVQEALTAHPDIVALGLEILSFSVVAVKAKGETARALEAEVREQILKAADDAIYARRSAAVDNERAIKESELDTEIAVELKQRAIREEQLDAEAAVQRKKAALRVEEMEAQIDLEDRRKSFVVFEALNARVKAEAEAHRVEGVMRALQSADPKIVQALAAGGMAPAQLIAMAFSGIAEKAEKIGQLNVSTELLHSLLDGAAARKE